MNLNRLCLFATVSLGLLVPPGAAASPSGGFPAESSGAEAGQSTEKEAPSGVPAAQRQEEPQTVGQRPEGITRAYKEIEAIFERQGVLTPRRQLVLEQSFQYIYSSSTRVALLGYTVVPAITIGLIDVRSVNRHVGFASFAARYGLTRRMEVESKVPYVYRKDSSITRSLATDTPESVFNADGAKIGDVEFGFRLQLNMPQGREPIIITGLRAKSDTGVSPFEVPIDPATNLPTKLATGSGFWALQPNVTLIFPSEPAVFFGSLSYLWNIDRTISGYGRIKPGDTVSGNFGIGYAMNERSSFSLGYEHTVVFRSQQNGLTLANSRMIYLGSFLLGVSYRVASNINLNLSLSGGLTEDAPDVQLTLRIPMNFSARPER